MADSSSASLTVADHIKARQSLIEWFKLAEILLIYVLRIFIYYNVRINVWCIKFSDILAYFYALDTFIEIRRAVTWLAGYWVWLSSK